MQVQLTNVTVTYSPSTGGVSTVTNLVQARRTNGAAANGNGYSGGPVIVILNGTTARAHGVISGMRTGSGFTAPCVG